jgi:tRNA U34 5-carboxymethylaminomethyl modifying GTPase MnmE/TrmE
MVGLTQEDVIEAEGIRRATQHYSEAHVRVLLVDIRWAEQAVEQMLATAAQPRPSLIVLNKADLIPTRDAIQQVETEHFLRNPLHCPFQMSIVDQNSPKSLSLSLSLSIYLSLSICPREIHSSTTVGSMT